jgi:hypothetical protein
MKCKSIFSTVMILSLALLTSCGFSIPKKTISEKTPETPNIMIPSIMVEEELYTITSMEMPIEPDESRIKTITAVIPSSQMPQKEGEINFPLDKGVYAHITDSEDYVVVLINHEWRKFIKLVDKITSGKYVLKDTRIAGGSWITLREDGTFKFMTDLAISYTPQGIYTVNDNKLYLTVSEDLEFVFQIKGKQLIFESDANNSYHLPKGSIFELNPVQKSISANPIQFTESEILEGMNLIEERFNFPDSTLTNLYYDEEISSNLAEQYQKYGKGKINNVSEDNVLVLLSEFNTGSNTDRAIFNPNSTYTDYQWILIRDRKENSWRIDDQGY